MKHVNICAMKQGAGELIELYLENGLPGGRILCPQSLMPAPGQYLLAYDPASASPLLAPVFSAGSMPGGFVAAPPILEAWRPGITLYLRGPLGRGFALPASARRVALAALGETFARLKPLMTASLEKDASIVLVSDLELTDIPPEVETQPFSALAEIARWADYFALDVPREFLYEMREMLGSGRQVKVGCEGQALVLMSTPGGGMGDCGVCAVKVKSGWKMACKDGPVFDLKDLI